MKNIFAFVLLIFLTGLAAAAVAGYLLQLRVAEQCPPQGAFITTEQGKIHYIERQGGEIPVVFFKPFLLFVVYFLLGHAALFPCKSLL